MRIVRDSYSERNHVFVGIVLDKYADIVLLRSVRRSALHQGEMPFGEIDVLDGEFFLAE